MAFDRLHWDAAIEERLTQAGQTGVDAADAREQLAHLRSIFGDDIHTVPDLVLRNLLNHAPWTHRWFDWFSGALRALDGAGGYGSLIRRLGRENSFTEAYTVLQVAERMRAVELIVDIDVPVEINGVIKLPDLRVTDPETNATFFVELSDLFLSERQVASATSVDRLMSALIRMPTNVVFSGQVLGNLSTTDAMAVAERIKSACREIECGRGYRELNIPDMVQFIVGHSAFSASVLAWISSRGLPFNAVAGLGVKVDRGMRFEGKVARKAKQLPPDSPNMLVIGSTELLRLGLEPHELVNLVRRAVAPHTQIAVIVVTSEEGTSSTPLAIDIGAERLLRSYRIGMTQHFLVVSNSSCARQLPSLTFDKVRHGFAL